MSAMGFLSLLSVVALTIALALSCQPGGFQRTISSGKPGKPEQIHLSLGNDEREIVVTWITQNATNASLVQYGLMLENVMNLTSKGSASKFVDGGNLHREMFVHRVKLTVEPGQYYVYRVGTGSGKLWSDIFTFTAPRLSGVSKWSPTIAVYGDLGLDQANSFQSLKSNVEQSNFDLIIHAGDFAYDMDIDNARVADKFMTLIEPLAANVPYMTCPGNHEAAYNFSNYVNRFTMPGGSNNSLFYSFNFGPAHFIALDTDFYWKAETSTDSIKTQYNWLVNDLKSANMKENRRKRPWIIVFGHHPMYCSSPERAECRDYRIKNALEELLTQYGADIEFWGHIHGYERLWPTYEFEVKNGTISEPYHNANAPLHITTAAPGNIHGISGFGSTHPAWSAFRSTDNGYSTMKFANATHINIRYFSINKGKNIDDFWVVKDTPFPSYYKFT